MRIAIAGFMHESNTFNPLVTDRAAFAAQSLTFGPNLVAEWRAAHHEVGGFLGAADDLGFEPVPLVMAWATPSGPVADAVLDEVIGHLITEIRRQKPDGLLLALHGAMVAESHRDADGEVVSRLRSALGPEFPIVVTLDLPRLPQFSTSEALPLVIDLRLEKTKHEPGKGVYFQTQTVSISPAARASCPSRGSCRRTGGTPRAAARLRRSAAPRRSRPAPS